MGVEMRRNHNYLGNHSLALGIIIQMYRHWIELSHVVSLGCFFLPHLLSFFPSPSERTFILFLFMGRMVGMLQFQLIDSSDSGSGLRDEIDK